MSSKPVEPRSIASQLVVLFTLAAALVLSCGIGVLSWIVIRHAFAEDNEVLADKVAAIRADLSGASGAQGLKEDLKNIRPGERTAYWVRILDAAENTITETPGMGDLLPPRIFKEEAPSSPHFTPKDSRTPGRLFSLVTMPHVVGSQVYIIQIGQDRSEDDEFMTHFAALVAAVLALGLVASAVIALTVTRRGLRPLGEMTHALQRVGPKQLHERVSPVGWPPELKPLAIAFDDMLDRLENSFSRLSQFSADLAHELRTPIANIRGEAEVALTRSRDPEEYRAVIESTVAECQHLTHIVDNLLFLARSEAAEGVLQRATFAGAAAVAKIVAFYEPVAEEQQVMVTSKGEADFFADEMLFGRAVSNLVENALRHTPAGGKIVISIASRSAQSEIAVTDNGSGIPAEHLPRVFDRFYRADTSRSSEGLGLGLALVKSITDLHGGSATIESEVGRGTTVTLTFPQPT